MAPHHRRHEAALASTQSAARLPRRRRLLSAVAFSGGDGTSAGAPPGLLCPSSSREPSSSVTPSASAWHPTIAAMRQLSRVLSPPRGFHADAAFSAQSPSQVGMEPALALRPVCSVRRHPTLAL